MIKRLLVLSCLLCAMAAATLAQEVGDTITHTFVFKMGDDMFYVPYSGNDAELAKLEQCVEQYKNPILEGSLPLMVDGYCTSAGGHSLRIAAIRSNRVKSELIMRCGLREECFITRNHASGGDYVTVRITVPQTGNADENKQPSMTQPEVDATGNEQQEHTDSDSQETTVQETIATPQETATECNSGTAAQPVESNGSTRHSEGLSIRANLLRWATLTPDLGIEWHITPRVGVVVNGTYTSWSWNNADRRFALWEVAPEVRIYLGKESRGYVGATYKAGGFNYKLAETGKQGDIMSGGITGGYLLRLNDALSIDFNIGIGCLHTDYDRYVTIDGVRVARGSDTKNWWGPISAGVTLVWRLL